MVSFCIFFSLFSPQHTIFYIVFPCLFVPAFLPLPYFFFLILYLKMSTPSCRRLLLSTAPAATPISGPQHPLPSSSLLAPALESLGSPVEAALPPVSSPSIPSATGALAHLLCLRCAKLAARHLEASCKFDKSNSEKCQYCQGQRTSCQPVSIIPLFRYSASDMYRFHPPWPSGAIKSFGTVDVFRRLVPKP
jgi:hypothetical protein